MNKEMDEKEILDDTKVCRLLQSSYDYNYLVQIIIGAGNTDTDFDRHHKRYNIAIGGNVSDAGDAKGLVAFPFYVPSAPFDQMIDLLGDRVGMIAIDYSVCCTLDPMYIIGLMRRLNKNAVLYIPFRNIRVIFSYNFEDIMAHKERNRRIISMTVKQFIKNGIVMEMFDDNMNRRYPIEKIDILQNGVDLTNHMSYAIFSFAKSESTDIVIHNR